MSFDILLESVIGIVILALLIFAWARWRARIWRQDSSSDLHQTVRTMTFVGDSDWDSLTAREKQVARHVGAGKSTKEVAQSLGIRPQTVSTHLKSIYRKMKLQSRNQLTARLRDIDNG